MNAAMAKGTENFRGLAADSREVKPGFLFAALAGSKTDGARFIADAAKRGAVAVLGVPAIADAVRTAGLQFIADDNPRLRLAQMAAEHYGAQPRVVAAVTGTNGKTSVASFLRQIWTALGKKAASLGTLGIDAPSGHTELGHTTPDPVALHAALARLKGEGVDYLAMEASSHGLDQFRLDGVRVAAAAFTNITRDHLDYHADFAAYLKAKLRLFETLAVDGGGAVVNADADHASDFLLAAEKRSLHMLTVGQHADGLRIAKQIPQASGQTLTLRYQGKEFRVGLPLAGSFQASNACIAAGLALVLGEMPEGVFQALRTLKGAPGRLELIAYAKSGAPVYVDYAHTPDALVMILQALRPHVSGRLHVVFGCGGDRDRGKRPLMGEAACRNADAVIVTDDNPRTEDASAIRREVLAGAACAREIGGRAEAIEAAIAGLASDDVLVLAGKGHEQTQTIGTTAHPFSDREQALKAALAHGGRTAESA